MYSSLIGKIEKAKRYAQDRDRVTFNSFSVNFRGDNDTHLVEYKEGRWSCTCYFFSIHGLCSHTMALQRMLEGMVQKETSVQSL